MARAARSADPRDVLGYYALLEVAPDATDEEIRRAYRREVRRWHPDRNASLEAEERIRLLNEAYEVLGDPGKRAGYARGDTGRRTAVDPGPPQPVVAPAVLDFGVIRPGVRVTRSVVVANAGGPFSTVDLENKFGPWYGLVSAEGGSSPDIVAHFEFEAFIDPTTALDEGVHTATVVALLDDQTAEFQLRAVLVGTFARASSSTSGTTGPPYVPAPPPDPAIPAALRYIEAHGTGTRVGLTLVALAAGVGLLVAGGRYGAGWAILLGLMFAALSLFAVVSTRFFTDPAAATRAGQWAAAGTLWLGRASLWTAGIALAVYIALIIIGLILGVMLAVAIIGGVLSALGGSD